jgi:hypothetical protein
MVKIQIAPNTMDHSFTLSFGCNYELVKGKMCYKGIVKIKNIKCGL